MAERYYTDGNTVRRTYVEPVERPQERPERSRREIEEERRLQRTMKAARKTREMAVPFRRVYAAFLTVCVAAIVSCSIVMVQTQASITGHMKTIATQESKIASLKAENDAKYKEIYASADLDHIKDVAINQLGMTPVSEEQVVYYTVDKSNYMDQYSDIPQ